MASALVHAAVPLIALRAFKVPRKRLTRRLAIAAVFCATWPDLDLGTLAFEIRPTELLGHRGLTHSFFAAAMMALAVSFVAFRSLQPFSRPFVRVAAFLFFAGAAHGVLDALTAGDVGVALFAPFENGRHLLPFKLLAVCPLGFDEYFGEWGLWTLANELFYVVIPLTIVVSALERKMRRRMLLTGAAWLAILFVARTSLPKYFSPVAPRRIEAIGSASAGDPKDVPHDDLPDGKLVTRFDELRARGVFDVDLDPRSVPWSSSFFPTWYGGVTGRWSDGAPRLVWRTLVGTDAPSEADTKQWLATNDPRLFTLSPTEKVDLALGHYDFPATKRLLATHHNARPRPRYWSGRCNGVGAASIVVPEPFRVVDVIAKDGAHVRFHPQDVKALLALAYDEIETRYPIGEVCNDVGFDVGATCSMNPAVLVIALANRLGIAKDTFLVDALPTAAKQYYAVASGKITVRGAPRPLGSEAVDPALAPKIASVVEVGIELTLSSTTLAYAKADVREDDGHYAKVGVVPVHMSYRALLALDAASELVGGRWLGDPADGPDDVLVVRGGPKLVQDGTLVASEGQIPWELVKRLGAASASEGSGAATLDLSTSN